MKQLLFIIILIIFLSCSGKEPQILQSDWDIFIEKDPKTNLVKERLTVFVQINDDDGIDDIENLYIINDKSRLF